ncbi:MAG: leucine-rich repeat domain-containing protein [Clostridia bacterium]|nr:leucine-rich repeat domain-containing protein [Clostridia bacterium]
MKQYKLLKDGTLIVNEGVTSIEMGFVEAVDEFLVKRVVLPESVTEIGDHAFHWFINLQYVNLNDNIKSIGKYAFNMCKNLKSVYIPNGLESISVNCFRNCESLEEIIVSDSVKEIKEEAFAHCKNLKNVKLSKNIEVLDGFAFSHCKSLKNIDLPNGLKSIGQHCFWNCTSLEELIIPQGVEYVCSRIGVGKVVDGCENLKSVICPSTAYVDRHTFEMFEKVDNFKLYYNDKIFTSQDIEIRKDLYGKGSITVFKSGEIFLHLDNTMLATTKKELFCKATKWNKIEEIDVYSYGKVLDWNKYNVVPHKCVVTNMPKEEIPLFYKDNNAKNWGELVKLANMSNDINKSSLFDIAHALGVFSPDGKESKIAKDYIIENIINKYDEETIHQLFSGINSYGTPYNSEYAKFFMLYFSENPHFMQYKDEETGETIDYIAMSCNAFNRVQKLYPNKKVVTRNDNERLTPELVRKALVYKQYKNVDERAEDFASVIGKYGYSEPDYKILESWYLQGIAINSDDITFKIQKDAVLEEIENEPEMVEDSNEPVEVANDNRVTYELLDKSNPLGAVLGVVTNCCQVLQGAGQACVEYGMTKPNSSFLVFRNQGVIIGQAWVWYDEKSGQVTLDNIEVPVKHMEEINKNKDLQKEFINCLLRVKQGFEQAMGKDKVKQVTIGQGYNDIRFLLDERFNLSNKVSALSDYAGYSDARSVQFIISEEMKQKRVKTKDNREQ